VSWGDIELFDPTDIGLAGYGKGSHDGRASTRDSDSTRGNECFAHPLEHLTCE